MGVTSYRYRILSVLYLTFYLNVYKTSSIRFPFEVHAHVEIERDLFNEVVCVFDCDIFFTFS